MKKNSSMNGKPEVPTSSETEMMVLSLNASAVSRSQSSGMNHDTMRWNERKPDSKGRDRCFIRST